VAIRRAFRLFQWITGGAGLRLCLFNRLALRSGVPFWPRQKPPAWSAARAARVARAWNIGTPRPSPLLSLGFLRSIHVLGSEHSEHLGRGLALILRHALNLPAMFQASTSAGIILGGGYSPRRVIFRCAGRRPGEFATAGGCASWASGRAAAGAGACAADPARPRLDPVEAAPFTQFQALSLASVEAVARVPSHGAAIASAFQGLAVPRRLSARYQTRRGSRPHQLRAGARSAQPTGGAVPPAARSRAPYAGRTSDRQDLENSGLHPACRLAGAEQARFRARNKEIGQMGSGVRGIGRAKARSGLACSGPRQKISPILNGLCGVRGCAARHDPVGWVCFSRLDSGRG